MTNGEEKLIGTVTHYYGKIGVAVVKLADAVAVGDALHFKGASTDCEETLSSMQLDHKAISSAKKGDEIAMKVSEKMREGDVVYKK